LDNLTHTLVGAALARTGLARATPLATATLVIAANAPDVDMTAYAAGTYAALAVRRGMTHGVAAMVVLPLLVTAGVLAWDRRVRRRRHPDRPPARAAPLLGLAALGALTHPVLDWTNTYGMRWWLPWSDRWSYGDALFIVDPWLWLLLGGAVLLCGPRPRGGWLATWTLLGLLASTVVVSAPVPWQAKVVFLAGVAAIAVLHVAGLPRTGAGKLRSSRVAVALGAAWVLATVVVDAWAVRDVTRAAAGAGVDRVESVMVAPLPGEPHAGDVVVRTPDGYVRGSWRLGRRPRARLDAAEPVPFTEASGVPADRLGDALARAARTSDVRRFLRWSRYPYWRVERIEDGYRVRVSDVRYDRRPAGGLSGVEVRVPAGDG